MNCKTTKKLFSLLLLFYVLLIMSCQNLLEEPTVFTITTGPIYNIAAKNQTVILHCEATAEDDAITFQWFKCTDISGSNSQLVENAITNTFETPLFTNREIRFYYCVVKNSSEEKRSNVFVAAYTGLPIVSINTPDKTEITSKEEWVKDSTISISGATNKDWNIQDLKTSIRGRGNSTWEQPKKPYAIKLDKKKSILGMPQHNRWVLIANYLDNSFIRNEMAFYLSRTFELDYTVRGTFVDLVLNGEYKGLYWLGEAIKTDENRVNIYDGSKNMSDDEDKDYLIEMDVYYDEPVKFRSSVRNLPYMIKNDDYMIDDDNVLTSGGQARLERLQTKIAELENLLYPENDENPDASYSQIIDIDSWGKFWLVNEIMSNGELGWPKSSYFTWDSTNDVLKAGPVWDFDWASLESVSNCGLKNVIYYNALFKSSEFTTRIKELWNSYYSNINISSQIETLRNEISIAAEYDTIIWGVNHNPADITYPDFDGHVDFLKTKLLNKLLVVNTEITSF